MKVLTTIFPGLFVIEPTLFEDSRGYFYESYNEKEFFSAGIPVKFVQDNQARSSYGVIRGLHYQAPPHTQSKLVRALSGSILDVVLDLRNGSPTYRQTFSIELSAENKKQLFIPKGFAHGYSVLSESAEVFYKCDAFYHKAADEGVLYSDPVLSIDWKIPAEKIIISEKDLRYPELVNSKNHFILE